MTINQTPLLQVRRIHTLQLRLQSQARSNKLSIKVLQAPPRLMLKTLKLTQSTIPILTLQVRIIIITINPNRN